MVHWAHLHCKILKICCYTNVCALFLLLYVEMDYPEKFFKLRTGKGSYGFGLLCHCTSLVPCPSFYRYYSFNSGLDESVSFKPGTISQDDVLPIAHELGSSWKMVGRVLNVPDAEINKIEENESDVSEKCCSKCDCVLCIVIMG